MPQYLHVPQGRSCRLILDESSPSIDGLYSDNFSQCNILIIYNHERMSLTHVDEYTGYDQITNEFAWVGGDATIINYLRAKEANAHRIYYFNVVSSISTKYIDKRVLGKEDDNVFGISIDREFNIIQYTRDNIPTLLCHPLNLELLNFHTINYVLNAKATHIQQILFNGLTWQPLGEEDMKAVELGERFFKKVTANILSSDFPFSFSFIKVVITQILNEEGLQTSKIPYKALVMLSLAFIFICSDKDFNQMFTHEINYYLAVMIQEKPELAAQDGIILQKIIEATVDDFNQIRLPELTALIGMLTPKAQTHIQCIYKHLYRASCYNNSYIPELGSEPGTSIYRR